MRKTNSKEFMAAIQVYLLDCITNEEWANEPTDREKIEYLFTDFDRVANHRFNLIRIPNEQERLADYLMGLPTGIAYQSYEILEVSAKLHNVEGFSEKMEDKIINGWWNFCAYKLIQLRTKLNK